MIFVKCVRGTLKGGIVAELGPKTLIVGPVGSKKSAIVNAVELAISARASDIMGRDVVADEALLLSMARPDGVLAVEATLSTGEVARYETVRAANGKARKATWAAPSAVDADTVLPLRALRAAVLGATDTARRFFLAHAGAAVADEEILARIPIELHSYYRQAIQAVNVKAAPVDKLLTALEVAKKKAREAKARAEEGATLLRQQAPNARPVSEEEYAAAKAAQTQAAERLAAVAGNAERAARRQADEREFEALKEKWNAARARRAEAEAQILDLTAEINKMGEITLSAFDDALATVIEGHTRDDVAATGLCLTCGGKLPPSQEMQRRLAAIRDVLEQSRAALAARERLTTARAAVEFDLRLAEEEINRVEAQGRSLKARIEAQRDAVAVKEDLESARAELDKAQAHLVEVEKSRAVWAQVARARDAVAAAEREHDEWSRLASACQSAVGELLDGAVVEFQAKVQKYLPASDAFAIQLREGDREVCRFGLLRDGQLHTALSGGEWARVTAALAAACCRPRGDKLTVIVPEDRGLDPDSLVEAMEAFSNVPAQVILTSTARPSRDVPGWTVIDRGIAKDDLSVVDLLVRAVEDETPARKRPRKLTPQVAPVKVRSLFD